MFDVVKDVLVKMNDNHWHISIMKEMVILYLGYIFI
jgi:hypothetical protein